MISADITVIKKDGSEESFIPQKIEVAVNKAAMRCDKVLSQRNVEAIIRTVLAKLAGKPDVSVIDLHDIVIESLSANDFNDVASSYAEYRYYKTQYAKTFEKLREDADDVLRLGDRENANFDSSRRVPSSRATSRRIFISSFISRPKNANTSTAAISTSTTCAT